MGKIQFQLKVLHMPIFGWKGSYVVSLVSLNNIRSFVRLNIQFMNWEFTDIIKSRKKKLSIMILNRRLGLKKKFRMIMDRTVLLPKIHFLGYWQLVGAIHFLSFTGKCGKNHHSL